MRILFMGTPEFALFSLSAIEEAGDEIVGVVTQADKPKGRGYTLMPPPVKVWATERDIPVFQPKTLRDGSFMPILRELSPDLIVVTAYGKILPEEILNFPRYGSFCVHTSLLPRWRGAAPMQRAIMAGDRETGATIMQMDAGIDTGDILVTRKIAIGENDNLEIVHDNLGAAGKEALLAALDACRHGTLHPQKQPEEGATYAAKIEKQDCLINFAEDAHTIHNRIRALSPMPLAFTSLPGGKLLKVWSSAVETADGMRNEQPGTVLSLEKDRILVACGTGTLAILGVLPEGKGRMSAADFIRGRKLSVGEVLGQA